MQVDVEGWKVRADTTTKLRSWASKAWYVSFVAHSFYKIVNFVYTLLFFHGIPLHQMVIHGVLASASAGFGFWYYILYVKYANENAALIRMTLTGTITGGITSNGLVQQQRNFNAVISCSAGCEPTDVKGASCKRGLKGLLEYTKQDLIAVSLPYMVLFGLPIIAASFVYDPTMRALLYSALPECWKNHLSFWICFGEEARFLLMFTAICVPTWQLQVISFDSVNSSLDMLQQGIALKT